MFVYTAIAIASAPPSLATHSVRDLLVVRCVDDRVHIDLEQPDVTV
jgi:hypothetical protein